VFRVSECSTYEEEKSWGLQALGCSCFVDKKVGGGGGGEKGNTLAC